MTEGHGSSELGTSMLSHKVSFMFPFHRAPQTYTPPHKANVSNFQVLELHRPLQNSPHQGGGSKEV